MPRVAMALTNKYMKCFQEHHDGGEFPTYEHRESDAARWNRDFRLDRL